MSAPVPGEEPKTAPPKKKTLVDLSKEHQGEIKTGQAMEELQNLPAWQFYQKILTLQLEQKRNEVEIAAPSPGEDGQGYALRMERAKGTIIGLRLALEQPSIMIKTSKELRARLLGIDNED